MLGCTRTGDESPQRLGRGATSTDKGRGEATAAGATTTRQRIARPAQTRTDTADDEILIVASRLKAYISRKGGGMNTSADVLPVLSDLVREAALDAIDAAQADGRKTVKARDFKRRR